MKFILMANSRLNVSDVCPNWRPVCNIIRHLWHKRPSWKYSIPGILFILLVCGYFLFDAEDFTSDGPWPGIIYRSPGRIPYFEAKSNSIFDVDKPVVTLAMVSCKYRMDEAITMLKSAIIFSKNVRLNIIAVTDRRSQLLLSQQLDELRNAAKEANLDVEYEVYGSWFPETNRRTWRRMWRPCSSQRLFFPNMFKREDAVIYVDTDTYFLTDLLDFWQHFEKMDEKQVAGMIAEHELPGDGWYNKRSKIPYYGPRGLNAGVMLMNLTRMRTIKLEERAAAIMLRYWSDITWADQDIVNTLFHFNPEYLYELKCEYNFRSQHCVCDWPGGGCDCKSAAQNGAGLFHGNREAFRYSYFTSPKLEFFRQFYEDIDAYNLRKDTPKILYEKLIKGYDQVMKSPCEIPGSILLSKFEKYINS